MTDKPRQDNIFSLPRWLYENCQDPALQVCSFKAPFTALFDIAGALFAYENFMQLLKDHLLSRFLGFDYNSDECSFTAQQRNDIRLMNTNMIVHSKVLHVNYTAYDICWDHNTIRIARRNVVITALRDDKHQFWYAQVLRALHLKVSFHQDGITC